MKRSVVGTSIAFVGIAVLAIVLMPYRSNLDVGIPALLLLIPVVVGSIVGGYLAGAICVVGGFLVLDLLFVEPFLSVTHSAPEVWAALAIYLLIMVTIARVVDRMRTARAAERRRNIEMKELFALSELLVKDMPLDRLLPAIVTSLALTFDLRQVGLFLPEGDRFRCAASTGEPFSDEVVDQITSSRARAALVDSPPGRADQVMILPLTATAKRVGILALTARSDREEEQGPLLIFANQIALAVERAELREQALQSILTEEAARLAKVLVAAVSHDLRAPLASIKASSSVLSDDDLPLSTEDRRQLTSLIDVQADRLSGMVQSLLDMSRIQSGVLTPSRSPISLAELVGAVVDDLVPTLVDNEVVVTVPDDLPFADIDPMLIGRVLTNLLMNAANHGPSDTPITVNARADSADTLELSVTDCGPGVRPERRAEIFDLLSVRSSSDAGTGLGLIIARTFVEAHGECIWVADDPDGGARFIFTVPSCQRSLDNGSRELELAANSHH